MKNHSEAGSGCGVGFVNLGVLERKAGPNQPLETLINFQKIGESLGVIFK